MNSKSNKDPKVSIVIPVYNGEKYLKYAIDSALAQTYENFEVLVVDDGSTDNTEEITKSYGNKIRYIKKENGGVSTALNVALKKMKGDYFSWLSHDDTYEPNKLKCEIDFLKEHNYIDKKVIVFSDYYLIDKNGKLISECKKDHAEIESKPEYSLLKGHINGLSLLIPKKAFDECGEFDEQLICAQDYEMWRRMMRKKYKFIHIPKTLVSTRWHKKQTTQTSPKVVTEGNEFYLETLNDITEERMIELEGSKYNFLIELGEFYKNSTYQEVSKYCFNEAKEILNKAKNEIADKKVSVIIPFFNRIEETERAIKSVLLQTHKNIEIVLVDDGSTENLETIKKIVEEHNILFVRNKSNLGASKARNVGIEAASGDYIAFLDSDDEFVPNKIEMQLQYIVASHGKFSHTSYTRELEGALEKVESGKQNGHCLHELIHHCLIATPTVMLEREWLISSKKMFDTTLLAGEDTKMWLELLKDGNYLVGINQPLSIVHVNATSAACDVEKQIIGLKAIIKYVLSDEYYGSNLFDNEAGKLMKLFVGNLALKSELNTVADYSNLGLFRKTLFFVKNEGVTGLVKRVKNKISNPKP